jgi:AcrR family transcriptional regulator
MSVEVVGPEQWVRAGFRALTKKGAAGVRVEVLARSLGVTKGSFYWHFADRQAFHDALLQAWEARSTEAVIELVERSGSDPRKKLERLLHLTTGTRGASDVEQAVRAWGATDARVRRRLQRVDERREAYAVQLLEAAGVRPRAARARARLFYLALIGEYSWEAFKGAPTGGEVWEALFHLMFSASDA